MTTIYGAIVIVAVVAVLGVGREYVSRLRTRRLFRKHRII